jgi:transposase InsO family protein
MLVHLSFDLLCRLSSLTLIQGLPKLKFENDLVCHPCRHGKMVVASHSPVNKVMTSHPSELLHIYIIGLDRFCTFGGKWYVLVVVDDFSRYSWVFFMAAKDEAFTHARDLILMLHNEFSKNAMKVIRSDNVTEFKNTQFATFCASFGLQHQFSSLYVPQQNDIIERNNQTLVGMARMMLDEHGTPRRFWAKAINIACHVSNRILLRAFRNKTSYELRFERPPKVSHVRVFGCRCFVLKQGNFDKFESRSSNVVFLGYALHSRAYRVLNLETNHIMETCEVTFDETAPCPSPVFEPTSPDQMGQTIFIKKDDANWVALEPTPLAAPIEPASTTTGDGPNPTSSTTWGPLEPTPTETRGVEAALEGRPLPQGRLHSIFSAVTHLSR